MQNSVHPSEAQLISWEAASNMPSSVDLGVDIALSIYTE